MNHFIHQLNEFANSWANIVWNLSWQSALLTAVLLVIVAVGRKIPVPVRYGILLVALLKFAVPPFLDAPTGLFSALAIERSEAESTQRDPVDVGLAFKLEPEVTSGHSSELSSNNIGHAVSPLRMTNPDHHVSNRSGFVASIEQSDRVAKANATTPRHNESTNVGSVAAQPTAPQATPAISTAAWLMLVHLAGSSILLAVLSIKLVRLSRLRRRSNDPKNPEVNHAFGKICDSLKLLRKPRLLVSGEIDAPISFGCCLPVVMIPSKLERHNRHCEIVFAHELAHIKRFDPWVNHLQNVLLTLWWFNPLLWVLNWQIRKLREDCCDDLVLANQFFTDEVYSHSLIEIAKLSTHRRRVGLQTAFSMAEHPLKDRIRRIMNPATRHARKISLVGGAVVLALCLVCLPGIRSVIAGSEPVSELAAVEQPVATANPPENLSSEKPRQKNTAQEPESSQESRQPKKDDSETVAKIPDSFQFKVVDKDGKPIAGATVFCSVSGETTVLFVRRPKIENDTYQTDEHGIAEIKLFKGATRIRIWTRKETMVSMFTNWEDLSTDPVPESFTLTMQDATTVGGRVVDAQGQPISGVRVEAELASGGDKLDQTGRAKFNNWLSQGDDAVQTNDQGKWQLNNVPAGNVKLRFKLIHPDYLADTNWQTAAHFGATLEQFRQQIATFRLAKGISISGKVLDTDGQSISDALVVWGDQPYWDGGSQETRTGKDGAFVTQALKPGQHRLTIVAKGWMPQMRMVELSEDSNKPLVLSLKKGKKIHLKFTDENGQPLPGTYVGIEKWRGHQSLYNKQHPNVLDSKIPRVADENGEYIWNWAPDDEIEFQVANPVLRLVLNRKIKASDNVQVIQFKRPFRFFGTVVDAKSGKPIDDVTITPVTFVSTAASARGIAQSRRKKIFRRSKFSINDTFSDDDRLVVAYRISALGYETFTTGRYTFDSPSTPIEVKLNPTKLVATKIVDVAGGPATTARIWLVDSADGLLINRFGDYFSRFTAPVRQLDSQGQLSFSLPSQHIAIVAASREGYAEKYLRPGEEVKNLVLQPWASLEGQLFHAGKPVADAAIVARPIRNLGGDNPHVQDIFQTKTDVDGRFRFEKLPPVPINVRSVLTAWDDYPITSNANVPVVLKPGENHSVNLGGDGLQVTGSVKLIGQGAESIQYRYGINRLVSQRAPIALPNHLDRPVEFNTGLQAKHEKWLWGDHGRHGRYAYGVKLNDDGTFLINGVASGSHRLLIQLYEPPEGCLVDPIGYGLVEFSTDDYTATDGAIDLGALEIKIRPVPKQGDVLANFSYQNLQGKQHYLSEHRGKYVMLDFWAAWCQPCLKSIPDIKAIHKGLDNSKDVVLLSVSLDKEIETMRTTVEKYDMKWRQGYVGDIQSTQSGSALGISSVPMYIVLDREGKIVARSYSLDKVSKSLFDALETAKD